MHENANKLLGLTGVAPELGEPSRERATAQKRDELGVDVARRLPKPTMIAGDDFSRLLDQLGEPHRTMVSLIAATGLRIGEPLALRWMALDLEGGTLAVRESVFEGTFQPPKTQKAMRTIPLGPRAVQALKDHRGTNNTHRR